MTYIKKTLRCNATKTVSGEEKTAAAERTFRKTFKKEKTDVDEKKKKIILQIQKKTLKHLSQLIAESQAVSLILTHNITLNNNALFYSCCSS